MRTRIGIVAALILTMASGAFAQETLNVGGTAPGLDIQAWVKGEEFKIEEGKVYVIDFWATWCGPCKKSIPHLTALQKDYADDGLTIIGISDEDEAKVSSFVRQQGDKMGYTVAVDRSKSTNRAWMDSAKRNSIPTAFIVDRKGKIAFIGNPLPEANEGFDNALQQVLNGRFNPRLQAQAEPSIKAARAARQERNWRVAMKYYDDVVALDARVFAPVAGERFEMMLVDMNDKDGAYGYVKDTLIGKTYAGDAEAMRAIAERIATDPKIDPKRRDLDVALQAAEEGRKLAGANDPKSLNTLALVRFTRGEMTEAVDLQKQAWMQAAPKQKPGYKRTLTSYQEAAQRTSMNSSSK